MINGLGKSCCLISCLCLNLVTWQTGTGECLNVVSHTAGFNSSLVKLNRTCAFCFVIKLKRELRKLVITEKTPTSHIILIRLVRRRNKWFQHCTPRTLSNLQKYIYLHYLKKKSCIRCFNSTVSHTG